MHRVLRAVASLVLLAPRLGLAVFALSLLLSPRLDARAADDAARLPVVVSVAEISGLPEGQRVLVEATIDADNPSRAGGYVIYQVSHLEPCGSGANGVRYSCVRDEVPVAPAARLRLADGTVQLANSGYEFFAPLRPPGGTADGGTVRGFVAGDRALVVGTVARAGGEPTVRAAHVDGRDREGYLVDLRGDPDSQAWAAGFGVVAACLGLPLLLVGGLLTRLLWRRRPAAPVGLPAAPKP